MHDGPLEVYVVGSLNMDFVLFVDDLTAEGRQRAMDESRMLPGGAGANQAVAVYRMSHLGDTTTTQNTSDSSSFPFRVSVSIIGKTGDVARDSYGDQVRRALQQNHVNTQPISIASGCLTGFAHVRIAPDGRSRMIGHPQANDQLLPSDVERFWPDSGVSMLIVQLEIPTDAACKAIDLAQRCQAPVVLNLTPRPAPQLLDCSTLFKVDHLIMSSADVDAILELGAMSQTARRDRFLLQSRYGSASNRFHKLGTTSVVITFGDMGVLASYLEPGHQQGSRGRRLWFFDAQVGPNGVRDETGASDAFVGAYAVEILKQLNEQRSVGLFQYDIGAALEMGIRAGGFAVGTVGAMDGIPWREDIIGPTAGPFRAANPFRP